MPANEHHTHEHPHGSELSEMQLRVRALETIVTEKGYVDPGAFDQIVENVETKIGPHIGAGSWPAPGPIRNSSGGCWRTRPKRSIRWQGSTLSPPI